MERPVSDPPAGPATPAVPAGVAHATLLALLLAGDLVLMALHVANHAGLWAKHPMLAITVDASYAEAYQYLKQFWAFLLLAVLARRARQPVYLLWALLFLYMLADDALRLHEEAGLGIARHFALPAAFGLRSVDLGELAFLGATAGVIALGLIALYPRSGPDARAASRSFLALLGVIAFFAVVVDMLHSLLRNTGLLGSFVGMIEDGGEMLAVSLALWYVYLLFEAGGRAPSTRFALPLLAARQRPAHAPSPWTARLRALSSERPDRADGP